MNIQQQIHALNKKNFEHRKIRWVAAKDRRISGLAFKILILWLDAKEPINHKKTLYAKELGATFTATFLAFKRLIECEYLQDITQYKPDVNNPNVRVYQLHPALLARCFKGFDINKFKMKEKED